MSVIEKSGHYAAVFKMVKKLARLYQFELPSYPETGHSARIGANGR